MLQQRKLPTRQGSRPYSTSCLRYNTSQNNSSSRKMYWNKLLLHKFYLKVKNISHKLCKEMHSNWGWWYNYLPLEIFIKWKVSFHPSFQSFIDCIFWGTNCQRRWNPTATKETCHILSTRVSWKSQGEESDECQETTWKRFFWLS